MFLVSLGSSVARRCFLRSLLLGGKVGFPRFAAHFFASGWLSYLLVVDFCVVLVQKRGLEAHFGSLLGSGGCPGRLGSASWLTFGRWRVPGEAF